MSCSPEKLASADLSAHSKSSAFAAKGPIPLPILAQPNISPAFRQPRHLAGNERERLKRQRVWEQNQVSTSPAK